jgi:hypothetical protein
MSLTPPAPSSSQNGTAERMIHTTNDVMRSLLFQASLQARYWAESLHAATYLLNLLPTKAISVPSTHFALCLTTSRLLVSQHVVFDESSFSFASSGTPPDDLDSLFSEGAHQPASRTAPTSTPHHARH